MAGEPFIDIIRGSGEFEANGYSDRLIADKPLGSRVAAGRLSEPDLETFIVGGRIAMGD